MLGAYGPGRQGTRLRAERLLRTEIGYLYHRSFDWAHGEKMILRPPVVNPAVPHTRRAPRGADFYFARLYEVPLLTPEEETYLFRKMNYLKFRADRLRQKLNPHKATASRVDMIERLLAEAQTVRNQIIEANLRLVFSLAKRYAGVGSAAFDEFIGEGHVTLMRAVEKFDFARGARFSTYAAWAVINACNALVKRQKQPNRRGFCRFFEGDEDYVADHRATADEERGIQKLRHTVDQLLLGLSPRERTIIEARFGFNSGRSPSLKEIGQGLGISKERVRQLQQRALDKLRALAERYHVDLAGH
jgi:RNA polymerase primary sigma factor